MEKQQVIPASQVAIISKAIEFYRDSLDKTSEEPEIHHLDFDLITLYSLMNYKVTVSLTAEEMSKFTADNGVDFPEYVFTPTEKEIELKETRIKDVQLVADFIGLKSGMKKYTDNPDDKGILIYEIPVGMGTVQNCTPDELDFTHWGALQFIVGMIEDITVMGARVHVNIGTFKISIYCSGILERELDVFSFERSGRQFTDEQKRNVLWEGIVLFVKWFNGDNPVTCIPKPVVTTERILSALERQKLVDDSYDTDWDKGYNAGLDKAKATIKEL